MDEIYSDTLDKRLKVYNEPLFSLDSKTLTYGCRHSNPDGCAKCCTSCCAFVRSDRCCTNPPKPWGTKYERLLNESSIHKEHSKGV